MRANNLLSVARWLATLAFLLAIWLRLLFQPSLAQSTLAQASANAIQVARVPLMSEIGIGGAEECVFLGNQQIGRTDGLEVVVFSEGQNPNANDAAGYIRWYVILRRIDGKPFDRDQQLAMKFLAYYTGYEPEVIHPIELRQGDLESRTSFLAPSYSRSKTGFNYWRRIVCRLYSDGTELRGLFGRASGNFGASGIAPAQPAAADAKKSRTIVIGSLDYLRKNMIPTGTIDNAGWKRFEESRRWILTPWFVALRDHLPTDWRELGAEPSYTIAADDLDALNPEQALALRHYILAGGELILADGLSDGGLTSTAQRWLDEFIVSGIDSLDSTLGFRVKGHPRTKYLQVGFGRIAFSELGIGDFGKPLESVGISHVWSRFDRLFNADPMTWMIPKLGQPPVMMFCLSIGAFAVVAGPGLLWWSSIQYKRPIWLLLLFPLFAMLITSSIFAYALIHDGFGTTGRILSLSWVDAGSGFGCAYSRQIYFSGFPPSEAVFSNRSEVWRVQSRNDSPDRYSGLDPSSEVSLQSSDRDQVYRGLLTPREQKQWMVTTPLEGIRPFRWVAGSDTSPPRVHNLLDESWRHGVFVDRDRKIYRADRVAAGTEVELSSIALEEAKEFVRQSSPMPQYPMGYFATGSQSLFDWLDGSANYQNQATVAARLAAQLVEPEDIIQTWPTRELSMPNRFWLLLERADYLDRPFKTEVHETDSAHVMVGTW